MKKLAAIGFLLLFATQVKGESMIRPGWYVRVDTAYPPAILHLTAQQQFACYDGTKTCNLIKKGEWRDHGDSVVVVTGWQMEYCPDPYMCYTPVPSLPDPECVWMNHDTLCYNWHKSDEYAQHFVYHSAPGEAFPSDESLKELATIFSGYMSYTPADPTYPAGTYYSSDMYEHTLLELRIDGTFSMKDTDRHEKKPTVDKGTWQVKGDTLFLQKQKEGGMTKLYFYKGRLVGELPANDEMPQYWVFYIIPPKEFKTNWKRG